MVKLIRLRRTDAGAYETQDGKYRVVHWEYTAGNRKSWSVQEREEKNGRVSWDFVCEVRTLADGRRYLSGDKSVFILS